MEGCIGILLTGIILGVLVAFASAWINKKNQIVALCEDVKQTRAAAISALQRRVNLINRLLQVALHYESYESRMISSTLASYAERSNNMSAMVANLTTVYPQLRANETYQELMKQLVAVERDVAQAFEAHNAAAGRHNIPLNQFPWNAFNFCSETKHLDTTMEQELLPVRFDPKQLSFNQETVIASH